MRPEMMPTPALDQAAPEELRETIREYFRNSWEVYERLFEVLQVVNKAVDSLGS